jgi:hypothetical protein
METPYLRTDSRRCRAPLSVWWTAWTVLTEPSVLKVQISVLIAEASKIDLLASPPARAKSHLLIFQK